MHHTLAWSRQKGYTERKTYSCRPPPPFNLKSDLKSKYIPGPDHYVGQTLSRFEACNDKNAFFTYDAVRNYNLWSCQKVCEALTFLLDNIYIRFGSKLYRQVVGIPMGTNSAPLVADLFLFCYERDFMLSLSEDNQSDVIEAFNSTSRYLDDLLALTITSLIAWSTLFKGWSGGAMVLGKLPVPGRPTILMIVGKGPIGACSRCGWVFFGHFYSSLSFLSFSLSLGDGPI